MLEVRACTAHACHRWLCSQVYGPNDLGKLTAGGHPRKLAQQQPQHEQNGAQMGSQNGVQAKPNTKPQGQQQQQQPQDKNPDEETPASAQVVPQNQVSHGQISKEQLSQVQRSQEQHSQAAGQGGLKEQGMGGGSQIEGTADLAAQAVPIRRADCFADFNPPTVEQYQEVRGSGIHADPGMHIWNQLCGITLHGGRCMYMHGGRCFYMHGGKCL